MYVQYVTYMHRRAMHLRYHHVTLLVDESFERLLGYHIQFPSVMLGAAIACSAAHMDLGAYHSAPRYWIMWTLVSISLVRFNPA